MADYGVDVCVHTHSRRCKVGRGNCRHCPVMAAPEKFMHDVQPLFSSASEKNTGGKSTYLTGSKHHTTGILFLSRWNTCRRFTVVDAQYSVATQSTLARTYDTLLPPFCAQFHGASARRLGQRASVWNAQLCPGCRWSDPLLPPYRARASVS